MKVFHITMAIANAGLAALCHERAKKATSAVQQQRMLKARNVSLCCAVMGAFIGSVTKSN